MAGNRNSKSIVTPNPYKLASQKSHEASGNNISIVVKMKHVTVCENF